MLRRRPHEPIPELLPRLDAAIASAQASGSRVDEINTASSGKCYENLTRLDHCGLLAI